MTNRSDWLNIGLIIFSLGAAYLMPFTLFLVAYAVLGPLHYFTEVHWIHKKGYFVKNGSWPWIALTFALLIGLPAPIYSLILGGAEESSWLKQGIIAFSQWTNGFIFLALVLTIGYVFTKTFRTRLIVVLFGLLISILVNNFPIYITIVGLLIPTIIHVYVFTLLFMLYGALKNDSKPGYLSVAMLFAASIIIAIVPINEVNYFFTDFIKETILDNNFHLLNTRIREILGLSDGKSFFFYEIAELKVQIFITFAYTYHYLNWFSKTSVIGWHQQLTKQSSALIFVLWLSLMGLFWWDYKTGVTIGLTVSFLHVLLEFPINMISIKHIALQTLGSSKGQTR